MNRVNDTRNVPAGFARRGAVAPKFDFSDRAIAPADPRDMEAVREVMRDPGAHGITRCVMCGQRDFVLSGFLDLGQRSRTGWGRLLVYVLCGRCDNTPDDAIREHVLETGGGIQ